MSKRKGPADDNTNGEIVDFLMGLFILDYVSGLGPWGGIHESKVKMKSYSLLGHCYFYVSYLCQSAEIKI